MLRIAWDNTEARDVHAAFQAFCVYHKRGYIAKDQNGKRVEAFYKAQERGLDQLTFDPPRTSFERIMEDEAD